MALRIRLVQRKLIVGNFDLNHIRTIIPRNQVDLVEDRDLTDQLGVRELLSSSWTPSRRALILSLPENKRADAPTHSLHRVARRLNFRLLVVVVVISAATLESGGLFGVDLVELSPR
jgi:hypothetical protein